MVPDKRAYTSEEDLVEVAVKRMRRFKSSTIAAGSGNLQPYQHFQHIAEHGIPSRLAKLRNVDIQNEQNLRKFTGAHRTDVTYADFCHVHQYLTAEEFTPTLLSDTRYDDVVNSIVSYMLDWPADAIESFVAAHPEYAPLCESLCAFRALDDGAYVYEYCGVPVVQTAIKIIKSQFVSKTANPELFDWMSLIKYDFVKHINQVYEMLSNNQLLDSADTVLALERDQAIPYQLPHIDVSTLKQYDRPDNLKFITGQACCCKTTIITKLAEVGWQKRSRGDIGGFNRGTENRASVGNLHAALHFMLTQTDVIGDRSFIDNVLWTFIMPACKLAPTEVVRELFAFLNDNFNAPAIAEYIRHKGVVFIDPSSIKNKVRQLKRCEDGDPWRARLKYYADVQFITYYTVARLFGWKVICVPYTDAQEIDDVKYAQNIESILAFFGRPVVTGIPDAAFSKPSNLYTFDFSFPKSVGIFK